MLTKEEFYKKIREKFKKRKLSIDFWSEMFYLAYKEEKMKLKDIFKLLTDVNKNQT